MSEDNNKTVSEDNNEIVGKDNNKIVIEYNNFNDDNNNGNENENENDDYYKIKQINNNFKKIDETKSFEEQINLLKGINYLYEYWHMKYNYDKELNLKIFKLKYAHLLEDLDEKLFEEIFGHTFVMLANKLMNTTSKEENCVFIRINPDEKDFNIFKEISKIHRHIKKSSEESLIDNISKKLLELEFKSNHSIKSKCLKWVVKKYFLNYKKGKIKKKIL